MIEENHFIQSPESMADVLGSLFFSIYQINLETRELKALRIGEDVKGLIEGDFTDVDEFLKVMAEVFYHSRSQNELISTFNVSSLCKYREDGIEKVERELLRMYKGSYHRVACIACLGKTCEDSNIILAVQDVDEQYRIRQNQFHMIQSLSSVYYTMYDIDLNADIITAIDNQMDSDIMLTSKGSFSQMMTIYGNNCIHCQERERFLTVFSIPYLQKELSFDNPVVELEYRRIYDYGIEWIRAELILVSMEDGRAFRVLMATRNITAQKMLGAQGNKDVEYITKQYHRKADYLMKLTKDLRAPINGLIALANGAETYIENKEKVILMLHQMRKCGFELLDTINELLLYSRIESGELTLDEEVTPVLELFNSLIADWEEKVADREHHLAAKQEVFPHDIVLADARYVKWIFDSVMDNAVRYTPNGGELVFAVRERALEEEGKACFELYFKDNGYGMSEEFCKHLFDPFSRVSDFRVAKERGIGLGMVVTKELVERMNGKIEIESEVDKGTAIVITLVFNLPPKAEEKKETDTGMFGSAYEPLAVTSFQGKKVLLYEENNNQAAEEMLAFTSVTVDKADNVEDLYRIFEKSDIHEYQLILMDIKDSHREVIKNIQQLHGLKREDAEDMPILGMVSVESDIWETEEWQKCVNRLEAAGICEILNKPLDLQSFLKALGWWMK